MKRIKYSLMTLGLVLGLGVALVPSVANAFDPLSPVCSGDAASTVLCKDRNSSNNSFQHYVQIIVNTLLFLVAAVSVVVIIIAGIYYTTSGGDAALVKRAKDALLYAVVGLVVSILAYAIVNFVITAFGA
jgi:hypothetical protein